MEALALFGGERAVGQVPEELHKWPIITQEDEEAVLRVLRRGAMSDTDVTCAFEEQFARWMGMKHAVAFCNGTLSLQAAMYACGLGVGDELICQSKTYWASCLPALSLGATIAFADIDPHTLCIDPNDLERVIGPRTKAILVVHYLAHPADMDRIMEIANRHRLAVIEDVSHAQGGLYKGRKLGTFGQACAMSLMSGKSLAAGEMGVLATNDLRTRDLALAFAHYERNRPQHVNLPDLAQYESMPLGGMKGRVNQLSSALAITQLKRYDERCLEIRRAMNAFWDELAGVPGVEAHRVDEATGSNMAGWYCAHGIYHAEELGGLPLELFCKALRAEGFPAQPGGNRPLHTHPYLQTYTMPGAQAPLRVMHAERDVRLLDEALPVTRSVQIFSVPWCKKYLPESISAYANAVKKVAANAERLMERAPEAAPTASGRWFFYGGEDD